MYEEVVTLSELSVAVLAYELFLRSGRPARASEQAGVVARRGVERRLTQPLPHQERRADVG